MLATARLLEHAHQVAKSNGGLATTGLIRLEPGSINTIPHTVVFSLDIRHHSDESLAKMEEGIKASVTAMQAVEGTKGFQVEWKETYHSRFVPFHQDCISAIRGAAEGVVGEDKVRDIVSGAGHDTCKTAPICPSGMVFVPSKDGLSHNPREFTSDEDW